MFNKSTCILKYITLVMLICKAHKHAMITSTYLDGSYMFILRVKSQITSLRWTQTGTEYRLKFRFN